MKDLLKKMNEAFRKNKLYYLFILLFFCVGVVLGVYTVKYMDEGDKTNLSNYFTSYINSLLESNTNYGSLFFNVLKKNLLLIVPIFLMSFLFFGAPIVLIIDLIKGFSVGYTFAFLITTYSNSGFMIAFISIIPQNLIYIPAFIILSIISLSFSIEHFKSRFSKKAWNFKFNIKNHVIVIVLLFILFGIGSIVETYISPNLIRFVVTKFYK